MAAQTRTDGITGARILCALVALAAGIVGVTMLVAPRSTGTYFSWALAPPVLAATIGAFYIASAIAFGWAAAREPWAGLRPICVAVFGLTLPTLVWTARHHDVFDFGRVLAITWVVLFIASPVLFGIVLFVNRNLPVPSEGRNLPAWARTILALLSALYAALAVVVWAQPDLWDRGPMVAGGLGMRFVGSWAAFLSILAAFAALRSTWRETHMPLVALVLWPVAALVAALLHLDELRDGTPTAVYVVGLVVLTSAAALVLAAAARDRAPAPSTEAVNRAIPRQ